MKAILLNNGMSVWLDDNDYLHFSRWKWTAVKTPRGWYAQRHQRVGEAGCTCKRNRKTLLLHREVVKLHGIPIPPDCIVDHIDTNTLNCCLSNLRVCTQQENCQNRRPIGGASQYKGVTLHKPSGRWRAKIKVDGKYKSLGYYDTEEEAAKAYDRAALESFGEYARINGEG